MKIQSVCESLNQVYGQQFQVKYKLEYPPLKCQWEFSVSCALDGIRDFFCCIISSVTDVTWEAKTVSPFDFQVTRIICFESAQGKDNQLVVQIDQVPVSPPFFTPHPPPDADSSE